MIEPEKDQSASRCRPPAPFAWRGLLSYDKVDDKVATKPEAIDFLNDIERVSSKETGFFSG